MIIHIYIYIYEMLQRFKSINWQFIQKIKYPKYIDKPCQQSQGTQCLNITYQNMFIDAKIKETFRDFHMSSIFHQLIDYIFVSFK
jgi:hypothetical protein